MERPFKHSLKKRPVKKQSKNFDYVRIKRVEGVKRKAL